MDKVYQKDHRIQLLPSGRMLLILKKDNVPVSTARTEVGVLLVAMLEHLVLWLGVLMI